MREDEAAVVSCKKEGDMQPAEHAKDIASPAWSPYANQIQAHDTHSSGELVKQEPPFRLVLLASLSPASPTCASPSTAFFPIPTPMPRYSSAPAVSLFTMATYLRRSPRSQHLPASRPSETAMTLPHRSFLRVHVQLRPTASHPSARRISWRRSTTRRRIIQEWMRRATSSAARTDGEGGRGCLKMASAPVRTRVVVWSWTNCSVSESAVVLC